MAKRLAIVLSGGGAKGAFQVGVLDGLMQRHGVRPSLVVGTSTGAIQALGVAQGDIERLKQLWLGIKGDGDIYKKRGLVRSALFGEKAINDARPLRKLLAGFHDPARVASSGIALRIAVASLQAGVLQTITQDQGRLDDWVYASCAMPVYFDPLETSDGGQWVDGGVRDVTPLGAAMAEQPEAILIIRASPPAGSAADRHFGSFIPIGLRAVGILQAEVSRTDVENTELINALILARMEIKARLEGAGHSAAEVAVLIEPFTALLAEYRFVPILVIEPEVDFSGTLEFDPTKIARAITAGQEALERAWPRVEALLE